MSDTTEPCLSRAPAPWWMGEGQAEQDACRCEHTAGHDDDHECDHGVTWR